jgi:para-nitrobenzyl esterase
MNKTKRLAERRHFTSSRREFISGSLALLSTSCLLDAPRGIAAGEIPEPRVTFPIVETNSGKIRGRSHDGIATYRGVPYGAPTGGANRFLPPKRPASWRGVRDALELGGPCPQANPEVDYWQDPKMPTEDCLVLNVWSAAGRNQRKDLPVMVWFHGGAYVVESAGGQAYDGFNLAMAGDVVVVSANHRLNVFGYTYLGRTADERFAGSGNVGQLDLIAVLEWVRDNIAHFGGDPGNVTIFGESGGGGKVSTTIAIPAAQRLFHKAIVQSGSFLRTAEAAEAAEQTERLYWALNVRSGDISALQRVPTGTLLAAYQGLPQNPLKPKTRPVVDGHVLHGQPWDPSAPELAAQIPMLIGTTREEAAAFAGDRLKEPFSDDTALIDAIDESAVLSSIPKQKYGEFLPIYRRIMPNLSNAQLVVRIATDVGMWRNALLQAARKLEVGGPPVYMYEFAWKTPCFGSSYALHAIDLPFVFGHQDYPQAWDDDDSAAVRAAADLEGERYRLSNLVMKAWAAFARTGDPSTSALKWPTYDLVSRTTMVFDRSTHLVSDPRSRIREMMLSL